MAAKKRQSVNFKFNPREGLTVTILPRKSGSSKLRVRISGDDYEHQGPFPGPPPSPVRRAVRKRGRNRKK
jgi:hypothetical protein